MGGAVGAKLYAWGQCPHKFIVAGVLFRNKADTWTQSTPQAMKCGMNFIVVRRYSHQNSSKFSDPKSSLRSNLKLVYMYMAYSYHHTSRFLYMGREKRTWNTVFVHAQFCQDFWEIKQKNFSYNLLQPLQSMSTSHV